MTFSCLPAFVILDVLYLQLDLANQLMSLKYLDSCSKKCPSCGVATIKNEGCNKMTCVYCSVPWCWKCGQVSSWGTGQ
jgi:hypothetical protein